MCAAQALTPAVLHVLMCNTQVTQLGVLAYPVFPNALGVAIAFAKHTGWRPKAGMLGRMLTRMPRAGSEQPLQQSATDATSAAAAAAGSSDASAAAAAAGAEVAGGGRSTRASARRQQQKTVLGGAGGLISVQGTQDAPSSSAAAAGCEVRSYADCEDDDELGPEMPGSVADMLSDVQAGRIAAATLILQAAEQEPNLPKDC
jgi:hypothetical protein